MGDLPGDEIDSKTLAATRRYARLRRRLKWSFLAMPIYLASIGLPIAASLPKVLRTTSELGLGVSVVLGFLAIWATCGLTWSDLLEFRCPRCGKRFIRSWYSTLPTTACKHCGLNLKLG